ncbi:receptor-like protein EIX2 [Ipomoea triloba]|uniref:receptor-like protein EIX2 n=1 Tax=Ipomoea triloba TaxID=35885 RepID=UPI00125E546C|nr:receptor-like protein EIX2 [Ipomoea triloba]
MNLTVFMDSASISMEARKLFILLLLLLHLAHFSSVAVSSNIILYPETEKDALLNFKQGFTNPSHLLSSWITEQDCCKWEGVECDNTTGHVTTLDLHSTSQADSLRGELRNSLLDLPYLRHLDLSHNDFHYIQIPDFIGSLKNLEYLNLSSANFRGIVPDHLGNLSSLQYLDLSGSGHNLRVNNHDWLSQLSCLKVIDLSWVNFGSWNSWLRAINMQPSLIKLNLSACRLYSLHIPPTLPFLNFTSLQILDLSHNYFGSLIPSWLFNLSSLATLSLKNSDIQGSIPKTFQTMTSLTVLDLSENNLRGELPSALPSLLKEVRFSGNNLNGSLAKIIMHLKHLVVLNVARNYLNDTLTEESLNFSDLKELDLSYNSIVLKMSQSWIPSFQLDVISLGHCQLGQRFPSWLRTQKTFSFIDISSAGISEKVPDWFWDLSPAMEHMNLSWNQLSGQLPDLSRFSLSVVDLSGNNFQGPVPHFSSMMRVFILRTNSFSGTVSPVCESLVYNNSLRFLDLSSNNLSGPLPDCLVNGTKLIVLNLGSNFLFGEIPQSLGNLQNLKILRLQKKQFLGRAAFIIAELEKFSGAIPPQLCRLEYLMVLDLSNNALTGTIPKCVNNFLIMAGVEGVPSFIFDQYTAYEKVVVETIIITIFSEYNRFRFPFTLFSLGSLLLTSIDLSGNFLSGEIPGELTSLVKLGALNLSANNLTGPIRVGPGFHNMRLLERTDIVSEKGKSFMGAEKKEEYERERERVTANQQITHLVHVVESSVNPESYQGIIYCACNLFNRSQPTVLISLLNFYYTIVISQSISMEARKLFILFLLLNLAHFSSTAVSSNIIRCPETEKDALLNFKQGFKNPSNLLPSWTTDQDCCIWEGIECDKRTGHVTTLDLHSTSQADSLRGALRNSLPDLPYLRHLDLSHNDFFYSQIPDFIGSFKNLEYLNLSSAKFSGIVPDHLGNLSRLQYLDLSGSGGILRVNNHDWLSQLSCLKVIDLSWVNLGSWNSWLRAINMQPSLIKLNLSACHLYSLHIPPTLPFLNFTSLQILDLSHNHFGYLIPSWLFNFSSLATLNLKNSEIQGSIPETFQTMTSLTVLDLSENNLRGELPSALPSLLKEVRFSGNSLNGPLAKNIMHLKHLVVLDVARNSLNDTLTQGSLNFSDLKELDLSDNSIVLKMSQSWIPSFQLDVIALRSCELGHLFPSWLRTQKTFSFIDISRSGISDKVPDWFWDLSPAMKHMDLSSNQLRGEVPDLSRLSLSEVDLSGNNFQGPVPHFSSMMKVFILTSNSFSGTVSPVCESLVYNNSLRLLYLSSNNLSGPLPDCWVNGTELIVLNLGSNFLFGEIPQSLGNLQNLKILRLQKNNFFGELPSSLQNLRRETSLVEPSLLNFADSST